jgi:hypothetical protein
VHFLAYDEPAEAAAAIEMHDKHEGAFLMARPKMAHPKSTPIEPVTPIRKQPSPDTGPGTAGQSGDLQGLSDTEESENESVRELIEEGQFYEASIVDGVENAPPPDDGPVRTHQRSEDDLPPEYSDQDRDEPKE